MSLDRELSRRSRHEWHKCGEECRPAYSCLECLMCRTQFDFGRNEAELEECPKCGSQALDMSNWR